MQRSNVLTGAEWISTRFGSALGCELSRLSVVIFAIVSVIGFLTYAFVGIGKFASIFLPWDVSPEMYAVILMGITTVYVMLGGMSIVVITDLIQYGLLSVTSVIICVIAMVKISPEMLDKIIPECEAILGFSLKDCPEFIGDEIEHIVHWKNGSDVSQLTVRSIRLLFVMKDADLYAIQFK